MFDSRVAIAAIAASISAAAQGDFEYEEVFSINVVEDGEVGHKVRGLNNSGQLLVKANQSDPAGHADVRVYDLADGSFVTVPEPVPFLTSILGQIARCSLNDAGDVAWDTWDPTGAGTGYLFRWSPGDADSEVVATSENSIPVRSLDNSGGVWVSSNYYDADNALQGLDNPPGSAIGTYHASDGALAIRDGNLFFQELKYWSDPSAMPVTLDSAGGATTAAVNESGQVAWSHVSASPAKIWSASDGVTETIPLLAGMSGVSVDDMNADGWVIGMSNQGPWLYRDGVTELLSDLTGFSDFTSGGGPHYQRYFVANDGTIATYRTAGLHPEVCTVFSLVSGSTPGDVDGDGIVGLGDLLIVLSTWGPCAKGEECLADIDGDGIVGLGDLLIVLSAWG